MHQCHKDPRRKENLSPRWNYRWQDQWEIHLLDVRQIYDVIDIISCCSIEVLSMMTICY